MAFAAIGAIAGALIGANASRKNAKTAAETQRDVAETPFRESSIKELLNEISSNLSTERFSDIVASLQEQQLVDTSRQTDETGTSISDTDLQERQTTTGEQAETATQVGTVTRGDEATREALSGVIGDLQGGTDAGAAMDAAISRVLRSGAPGVSNVLTQTGGFDNTTAALLQNDLINRAAESAAGIQLQQDRLDREQLLQAIATGQAGTETTEQEREAIIQEEQRLGRQLSQTEREQYLRSLDEEAQERARKTSEQTTQEQTTETQQEETTEKQSAIEDVFRDVGDDTAVPGGSALGDLVGTGSTSGKTLTDTAATDTGLTLGDILTGGGNVPNPVTGARKGSGEAASDTADVLAGIMVPHSPVQQAPGQQVHSLGPGMRPPVTGYQYPAQQQQQQQQQSSGFTEEQLEQLREVLNTRV